MTTQPDYMIKCCETSHISIGDPMRLETQNWTILAYHDPHYTVVHWVKRLHYLMSPIWLFLTQICWGRC